MQSLKTMVLYSMVHRSILSVTCICHSPGVIHVFVCGEKPWQIDISSLKASKRLLCSKFKMYVRLSCSNNIMVQNQQKWLVHCSPSRGINNTRVQPLEPTAPQSKHHGRWVSRLQCGLKCACSGRRTRPLFQNTLILITQCNARLAAQSGLRQSKQQRENGLFLYL